MGVSGLAGLIAAENSCAGACGFWPHWRMPRGTRTRSQCRRGKKNAPLWAHHPVRYSACLTRGLRPRGLSTSASTPPSRYWRHHALTEDSLGILCLTMASRTVKPFSRRSLTTASLTSYEYVR